MKRLPRILPIFGSLLGVAAILHAADVDKNAPKSVVAPEIKTRAEYEEEAKLRIANFTMPKEVKASLYVDASQTQNPCAITFQKDGTLLVAEIHRWRAGVEDIRNEKDMLMEDLAIMNNQDRLKMYEAHVDRRPMSYYTEFEDRIVSVKDTNGDGTPDKTAIFADGFNDALDGPGIGLETLPDGSVFYTNIPHLWKLQDTTGDGKADVKESIQDGFGPRMSFSGHDMHGVIVGPDGRIYWSIGDRGYSFTTKEGRSYQASNEGAVFRCDPDGSNLEVIYTGLRNPQELAFDKYGNLFTCDNDADQWDTGRLVYIIEGGDSGWHAGHQTIIHFREPTGIRTPSYDHPGQKKFALVPWLTEGIWEPRHEGQPQWHLPPIDKISWGPSGLVYNYGATSVPDRYAEHFWVCNFGGSAGDLETFSVTPDGAGFKVSNHEIYMKGSGNTDVEFGPDGRMYLACFNNNGWTKQDIGNVYALENRDDSKKALLESTAKILTSDIEGLDNAKLAELLTHADMRVRQRAQFALVANGDVESLKTVATKSDNPIARLHGVWGIGQLARKDEALLETLITLLTDADDEVRTQAAKTLGDSRVATAGPALLAAIDDPNPRVKAYAAIGVGKTRHAVGLDKLIELLATNNNADLYLRHAAVQGMWFLNEREKMLKQVDHESAAVRLGILLTLRKLEDPRVNYFLSDPDKSIRQEAIRAIHDKNFVTVLPDIAEQLTSYESDDTHRDWIIQTRLVNANFRLGAPENAARLLEFAANGKNAEIIRGDALRALAEWKEPTVINPVTGYYAPLDNADNRPDISDAVKAGLPAVFDSASGELISLATDLALAYGADAPVELLTKQLTNKGAALDPRISALNALVDRSPKTLDGLWDSLLKDKSAKIRAAAAAALSKVDTTRGLDATIALAKSNNLQDRQNGYRLLAGNKDPKAIALIKARLTALAEGKEKLGAALDLLESAAAFEDTGVTAAVKAYEATLDPADPYAAYQVTLEGGDKELGANLFMTHPAGQCTKCHKVGGKPGPEAGPNLAGVGKRGAPDYILESLINPSAKIVPGYGLTLMTLKDGTSIGGTLLNETDKDVTVRIPDPENPEAQIEKTISLTDIATRQPPISAMPPVGVMMTKSELRDIVAYLKSLKKEANVDGH